MPTIQRISGKLKKRGGGFVADKSDIEDDGATHLATDIYIDTTGGGSDSNDGLSVGSPLATPDRLIELLQGRTVAQNMNVHVTGNLSNFSVYGFALKSSYVRFVSNPTVFATGTITGYNASNASAKTLADIADSAVSDWTTYRQLRIVITTTGAHQGTSAWLLKNTQSGNPITTKFAKSAFSSITTTPTPTAPSVGDAYEIQTLSTCAVGFVSIDGDIQSGVVFDGFDMIGGGGYSTITVDSGCTTYMFNCRVTANAAYMKSDLYFVNSLANEGLEFFAGASDSWIFNGGLSTRASNMSATTPSNGVWVNAGAKVTLYDDVALDQVRGILVRVSGHCVVRGGCGFRRSGSNVDSGHWGSHIVVKDGGVFESFGAPIYGAGATRRGLSVDPGGDASFEQEPYLTGDLSGGDFECEKLDTARAYDSALDIWSPPISATFANLFASQGSGGFGGQAHFKEYGCVIYKKVSFP